MALPKPELGLVVHYSYLFHSRTKNIGDAGKARPCLIVAVFAGADDPAATGVLYLPITHAAPGAEEVGLEIPADVRFAAGLDGLRQWALVSQGNRDVWPEDVFNLPGRPGVFQYGFMPPGFYNLVKREFAKLYARRKFNVVLRGLVP